MKITAIKSAVKTPGRFNIFVDDKYSFSLDESQIIGSGIKIGKEYTETELAQLKDESVFGKLYMRALEYSLSRPHSAKEIRDYLWRKTRTTKYKSRSGELKEREGVSETITGRVFDKLVEKGYIDDEKFTRFWVENRNQKKGTSKRKLTAELRAKGVDQAIIDQTLSESSRTDEDELQKIIAKKRNRYADDQKFMQYLARQGFGYDDIKEALREDRD